MEEEDCAVEPQHPPGGEEDQRGGAEAEEPEWQRVAVSGEIAVVEEVAEYVAVASIVPTVVTKTVAVTDTAKIIVVFAPTASTPVFSLINFDFNKFVYAFFADFVFCCYCCYYHSI